MGTAASACWRTFRSDASDRQFACHGRNSAKPGKYELLANVIAGSEFLVSVCFIRAKIERSLLRSVLAQFSHLVHDARNGFLLLPLILSLCFVPLSLLPRVLFFALCECRSASWHLYPLASVCLSPTGIWQPNRDILSPRKLHLSTQHGASHAELRGFVKYGRSSAKFLGRGGEELHATR
jgi:hypothetical protein